MKKTLLILAVAFSSAIANAQSFKKADKFVEGTVSYSKTTDADAVHSLNPTLGTWLTDRFSVGVFGEFAKSAEKTTGFGAFGRCQFLTIGKNINVTSQLSIGTTSVESAGVKTSTFNTNLGLGAYYFVTRKLAITANVADLVSYTSAKSVSTLTVGFDGVNNPFSTAKFGVSYKF